MDNRERFDDEAELSRVRMNAALAGMWSAMPCIVESYDPGSGNFPPTVVVQPAILGVVEKSDGTKHLKRLPLLVDVPVVFLRGGQVTITLPIAKGDECLVVFASRCIDAWHQSGGLQPQYEPRKHDLSDGFAIVGLFSNPTKIPNISTTTVQLRSNDGATMVELDPSGQIVNVVAPGGMNITAPTLAISGKVTVSEDISAQGAISAQGLISSPDDVHAGSISLKSHTHSGVQPGGGNTGLPE